MKNFLMAFLLFPFVLSGATITDGLIAWYKFDGDATDSSGNGNHGVEYGAVPTKDRFGNADSAYQFSDGQYIIVADSASLNTVTNEITVSTWAYIEDLVYPSSYGTAIILGKGNWEELQYGMHYCRKYDMSFSIGRTPDGDMRACTNFTLPLQRWIHLAYTFRNGIANMYLNGNFVSAYTNSSTSFYPGNGSLRIGKNTCGTQERLHGSLDDLRIYNRALAATEVSAIYNDGGSGGSDPSVYRTVTFNANGGTVSAGSRRIEDGAAVGALPTATWGGHEFLGWFTAAASGMEVSAETKVTSDVVLYAHWQEAGVAPDTSEDFCSEWTSAGTLDLSTGERRVSEAQAVSYGSTWFENGTKAVVKIDGVSFVEKAGTGLVSWSGAEKKRYTLTHQVFNAVGVQVGDTYTATFQWVNRISVTFAGNMPGVADQTKTYDEGSVYGALPEVSCQNYEFLGWWTSASGGQQVATNDIVLVATTLYAHWRSTYIACTPKAEITPVVVTVPSGASVKVSGLPSGLKFTAKALTVKATRTIPEKKYAANTIYGTPSRSGVYAATVTTTVGTGKSAVSTSIIKKFVVRTDTESMIDAEWDPSDGKVTGMAVGSVGKKVTLKAVASRGFVFAGWYCDSDFTMPMSGAADYRSTSQTLQIEKDDATYYARFVPASADGTLVAQTDDEYAVNGPVAIHLDIESLSLPTVTVKGLPTGLKFDAKTLTISGTPTKPGSYTVSLSLKNTTVKKAVTQTFKINVANIESPYLSGISYATDAYNYRGGVAVSWDVGSCATDGYAVSSVSGLPAGLKFNVKTGKIEGVPTKAGTFTATITLKNGKMSSIATVTLNVQAIDTWAYGTFNGGSDDGQVQLTITSAGKLSGKYLSDGLTYALASSSFSHYANGVYQAEVKASWSYKDGKNTVKKTDVWPLVVEADVVGGRATNGVFSAWQNVWSQKDWKTFGISYFGQSGTTQTLVGSDYGLADGESIVMKVKSNGSVTLKGVFATDAVKNGKAVYYTATGSAVVCAQSPDPFEGEVFIYFPPNATKKFNGYVRVVSIGE